MTSDRSASPARRPGRGAALGLLTALGALAPAAAQEPLLLRIRAHPDRAAVATDREAAWARSQERARAVIASVCTGCLAPWRPPEAAADPRARTDRIAALAERAAAPAPRGLEPDPALGASDPSSEPSSRERHP